MGRPTNECKKPISPYATYVPITTTSTTTTSAPQFSVISYPDHMDSCPITTETTPDTPVVDDGTSELVDLNSSYVCNSVTLIPPAGGVILKQKFCSKNSDGSSNICVPPVQNMLITGLTTLCLDNNYNAEILSGSARSVVVADCHCSGVSS